MRSPSLQGELAAVDDVIHAEGATAILEDCRRRFLYGLATGDFGRTTAGLMPTQWVIHLVDPNHNAVSTLRTESCGLPGHGARLLVGSTRR